jgi:glycosyltransferase involved in cell wall biosynthesis
MSTYVPPDVIRQHGLSRDNYLLYIGRLSREKGVDYLIDAYNEIDTRKGLVLAGDYTDDGEFHNVLSETIGRCNQILLLGYVDGQLKAELMSNAYCVVFPGIVEGSPVALLEAMSYGNCCVASDIAEHLELMHGFGYTFKMGDGNDLRWLLSRLLSQKRMVNSHKKEAQMYVRQNHDWDKVIDSYENLYVSLMHKIGEQVS